MGFLCGKHRNLSTTWLVQFWFVKAFCSGGLIIFIFGPNVTVWRWKLEFISVLVMRCRLGLYKLNRKTLRFIQFTFLILFHCRRYKLCFITPTQLNSIRFDSGVIRLRGKKIQINNTHMNLFASPLYCFDSIGWL